ncbi:hypothetical protein C8A06_1013 [Microbacteriaceae bacterium MWH-Ta3]|nr:hypothetical protein C8A06_1013 [Microbacteriaceae bacterium MWH-Ta3]
MSPNASRSVAIAVSGTAVAAAVIGSLSLSSLIAVTVPNDAHVVVPTAVQRQLVCAGGIYDFVGDQSTLTLVGSSTPSVGNGEIVATISDDSGATASIINHLGDSARVSATETASFANEEISGFLAAECGDPLNEAWLVGGDTTTGRDSVIVITNSSDVAATIDLEVFGSRGAIESPGAQGIVIAAQSQRAFSLAGFAPAEPSPVVHVTSNGAPVWTTIQTTIVRGLVAGGLDSVTPASGAAMSAIFPLVVVPDQSVVGPLLADPDFSDMQTLVRVFVPGDTEGVVTIRVTNIATGEFTDTTAEIAAGRVFDVPLAELAAGNYSVDIAGGMPFVASVRFASYASSISAADIAWATAAPQFTGTVAVTAPTATTLAITNPGEAEATVAVSGPNGARDYSIAPHTTRLVAAAAGTWVFESTAPVSVAQVVTGSRGIAVTRGVPAPGSVGAVSVFTG